MLKRLLLISLISIVPIQAWAALDMSMKHQINGSGVEAQTQTQAFSHPCHQEGNSEYSGGPWVTRVIYLGSDQESSLSW
jgi:hypothetical protein